MESKFIAVYCRTACADDMAIDLQKRFLESYVKAQGYTDVVYYMDNGYSGLSFDRPAFSRLDRDISEGKIKMVIVRSLSRVCRDAELTLKWVAEAQKLGVSIVTLDGSLESLESLELFRNLLKEEVHEANC